MNVSISRNGKEIGEWSEEHVRTLFKEGQLLPTDHYWREGMTEWAELPKMIKPPPPMMATSALAKTLISGENITDPKPRFISTKGTPTKALIRKPGNWFRTTAVILFLFIMMCIGIDSVQDKLNRDNSYAHTIGHFTGSTYTVFTKNGSPERYAIHYSYIVDGVEYQIRK